MSLLLLLEDLGLQHFDVKVTGYRRARLRVGRSQHVSNKVKCNISKTQNVIKMNNNHMYCISIIIDNKYTYYP